MQKGKLLRSGIGFFTGLKDKSWKKKILVFSLCFGKLIKIHHFDHLGVKCDQVGIFWLPQTMQKTTSGFVGFIYFLALELTPVEIPGNTYSVLEEHNLEGVLQ